jgi:hypothetical protein
MFYTQIKMKRIFVFFVKVLTIISYYVTTGRDFLMANQNHKSRNYRGPG